MAGEAARPRTGELIVTGVPAEPGLAVGMSEEARGAFSPRPALVLLCALLVIDFASRQFVVTAFPYLWAEFAASEVQLGALVSAVSVVVALGAFPIALTVDRWSRVREIAVTVWSGATAACAFADRHRGRPGRVRAGRVGVAGGSVSPRAMVDRAGRTGLAAGFAFCRGSRSYGRDRARVGLTPSLSGSGCKAISSTPRLSRRAMIPYSAAWSTMAPRSSVSGPRTPTGRSGCSAATISGLIRPRTRNVYSLPTVPPQLLPPRLLPLRQGR
jgi:hypothetical protein